MSYTVHDDISYAIIEEINKLSEKYNGEKPIYIIFGVEEDDQHLRYEAEIVVHPTTGDTQ